MKFTTAYITTVCSEDFNSQFLTFSLFENRSNSCTFAIENSNTCFGKL